MNQAKATINQFNITFDTDMARQRIEETIARALRYSADPEKKKRLSDGYCKACYYSGGRIGGAAMINRPCGVCETDMMFGSTATDKVCKDCAIKYQLCRQCGADLHLKPRRKWEDL